MLQKKLSEIAERFCGGKLLVMGGDGYNHSNIAKIWTAVVAALAK